MALLLIIGLIASWWFSLTRAVSRESAELSYLNSRSEILQEDVQLYNEIKERVALLGQHSEILGSMDSKIDVSNVLAELSYILNEDVVLSKLNIHTEAIGKNKRFKGLAIRRVDSDNVLTGNQRFAIVLNGKAKESKHVADMICRIEDSQYFFNVIPLFTGDKKAAGRTNNKQPDEYTEFEVGCYLANYREML